MGQLCRNGGDRRAMTMMMSAGVDSGALSWRPTTLGVVA